MSRNGRPRNKQVEDNPRHLTWYITWHVTVGDPSTTVPIKKMFPKSTTLVWKYRPHYPNFTLTLLKVPHVNYNSRLQPLHSGAVDEPQSATPHKGVLLYHSLLCTYLTDLQSAVCRGVPFCGSTVIYSTHHFTCTCTLYLFSLHSGPLQNVVVRRGVLFCHQYHLVAWFDMSASWLVRSSYLLLTWIWLAVSMSPSLPSSWWFCNGSQQPWRYDMGDLEAEQVMIRWQDQSTIRGCVDPPTQLTVGTLVTVYSVLADRTKEILDGWVMHPVTEYIEGQ